jgi:hypothetical protein
LTLNNYFCEKPDFVERLGQESEERRKNTGIEPLGILRHLRGFREPGGMDALQMQDFERLEDSLAEAELSSLVIWIIRRMIKGWR